MPMGGEGSRFKSAGIDTPKPLIKANGVSFFERALRSISECMGNRFKLTCIVRLEHVFQYHIDEEIQKVHPANIIGIEKTTRGAVETVMLAAPYIEDDDAVLVMDCDLEFRAYDYIAAIMDSLYDMSEYDGLLLSFKSTDPRYSYAAVDSNGIVIQTAEKIVISDNALIGSYFFSHGKLFKEVAQSMLDSADKCLENVKELYTSLLYNKYIDLGKKIKLYHKYTYNSFGTPEELKAYEENCNNN